jgi:ATP citrate (pro-S)-lyase
MPENIVCEYSIKKLLGHDVKQIIKGENYNINEGQYVIKVDQQIKGRGKKGLIGINYNLEQIDRFVQEKDYNYFIVEDIINIKKEHYFMIIFTENGDKIYFGEDVGGVDFTDLSLCKTNLLNGQYIDFNHKIDVVGKKLYDFYKKYHLTFLEVNPLIEDDKGDILPIDFAVKWDTDSKYLFSQKDNLLLQLNTCENRSVIDIEQKIEDLDSKSGASMKFKLINKDANIWTIVAGGGASVMYTDAIINLGYKDNLGNYGEYSGNPSESEVYQYTHLVIKQIIKSKTQEQMYLIIGGGISNFTMVDATFKGIIKALHDNKDDLLKKDILIIVRRGGLNYKVGLKLMNDSCKEIGIKCHIYGPETHITNCLINHLEKKEYVNELCFDKFDKEYDIDHQSNININGKIIILNLQTIVGQRILDYDYICGREPSIAGFIYPSRVGKTHSLFYGDKEIMVPIYGSVNDAVTDNNDIQIGLNYFSFRSAYDWAIDLINNDNITTILIVAEGIPMQLARDIKLKAREKQKIVFGPSSVGCLFVDNKRFGNAMGSIENIEELGLFNKGRIGLVTKSGGLLNEMSNMINRISNIYSGIAVGGDRYPSCSLVDVCMFYQKNKDVDLIVLLGEIGGDQELKVAQYIKKGMITKPLIGWCTGTSSQVLTTIKQFGHAGSYTNNQFETAVYKNYYFKESGALVPETFEDIDTLIKETCLKMNLNKIEKQQKNVLPFDFNDLIKRNMIRVPSEFVSSISNEKGDLTYNNKPLEHYLNKSNRLGNVIGALLFKKDLPDYLSEFIEMVLATIADHGIAVSSAHNTAVCARSGQNISSSVASGMLCINQKHGGALQDCAVTFYNAKYKDNLTPKELVDQMKSLNKVIPGIGHAYKNSTTNKDKRLECLMKFIDEHFPNKDLLDFAKDVESITLQKKENLILNVDGLIAVTLISAFIHEFGHDETTKMLSLEGLNSIFIIGRTIGLCGTFIDQNRLGQGLYRHPSHGINYID